MTRYSYTQALRLANAAGMDAANKSMRAGNRSAWNETDQDKAFEALNAVLAALGFGHLISE